MRRSRVVCAALLASAVAVVLPARAAEQAPCGALAGRVPPDVRIALAAARPAAAGVPAHCEVVAALRERVGQDGKPYAIGLRLRMPVAWNGRLLVEGGAGTDGFLGTALGARGNGIPGSALEQGYAVASTDGGHLSESAPGVGAGLFGLEPQARIDYGYNALDVATRTAKALIELHHGAAPRYTYFVGCSNGGRQGMVASQRFAEHFDGIVAGNPGFNLPQAAVAQAWDTQAFAALATTVAADGQPHLASAFSDDDLALVAAAVLARCDALDGLEDGIVDALPACRFRPTTLACDRSRAEPCLSPAQVRALETVFGGARNSRGRRLYANWPFDAGIGSPGWRLWKLGSPGSPVNNALNVTIGGMALPYVFVTPPDPVRGEALLPYLLAFDFDRDARRIFATSGAYAPSAMAFMSAPSVRLETFRRRSGKLIVYHGASDPVFSVHDTVDWYRRFLRRTPRGRDFARLFVVPGMTHCSGGPATESFDVLAPIVDWVEHGRAPDRIVARARAGTPWPGRTRPLCPYPEQSRYLGSGDVDDADSFRCTLPRRRARR